VPYVGRTTVLLKETSLASAISVPEVMSAANGLIYSGADPLLLILIAGAIYAILSFGIIGCGKLIRPAGSCHGI
jgi:ABC-type amino acid transport system permease subunit